jgi:hypothetical protein
MQRYHIKQRERGRGCLMRILSTESRKGGREKRSQMVTRRLIIVQDSTSGAHLAPNYKFG